VLRLAQEGFVLQAERSGPLDRTEDILEAVEGIQLARNYLAARHHSWYHKQYVDGTRKAKEGGEENPSIDLPEDHGHRVAHHARYLRRIGRISTEDWRNIGLAEEPEAPPREAVNQAANWLLENDPRIVSSLMRPDWDDHFPQEPEDLNDQDERARQQDNWTAFKAHYPEDMQLMLDELYEGTQRLATLQGDKASAKEFAQHKEARADVLLCASSVRVLERTAHKLRQQAAGLRSHVPEGQPMPTAITKQTEHLEDQAAYFEIQAGDMYITGVTKGPDGQERPVYNEPVMRELERRSRLDDRRELRHGLLYTPGMEKIVTGLLPEARAGSPVLLVGETGGAKTAVAEHMASKLLKERGKDPRSYEFVSGYGQMTASELMGGVEVRVNEQGPFTEFVDAAAVRAMKKGVPLVIDEINATDPTDLQKRLNKILQLSPGEKYQIQENNNERIVVQPGFCIIMTANEKSARYTSVHALSADFKSRLATTTARVEYPDINTLPGQVPTDLVRLAQATLVDQYGTIPTDNPAIDEKTILKFVGACHRLQRMFTLPKELLSSRETMKLPNSFNDLRRSNKTFLEEETISPRTMTTILGALVRGGHDGVRLPDVLERFVSGVTNQGDRELIQAVLAEADLLKGAEAS